SISFSPSQVCLKLWRTLELAAGSPSPPMRINSAITLLGGEVYLFGGLNAGPSQSMWVFNVRKRLWRPVQVAKGKPPAPRHGHTMIWDGLSSHWVLGGQGAETADADSSRTHQGIKIRTLAKRTCYNDFLEFNTETREWLDHVQAGVCPTSRRGHTATLVLDRCPMLAESPPNQVLHQDLGTGGSLSSQTHISNSNHGSHSRRVDEINTLASGSRVSSNHQGVGQEEGIDGHQMLGYEKHGQGLGCRQGKKHRCQEDTSTREMGRHRSREMFMIGGAGTDPIRNMEVVHTQLWIFNFDSETWTCVADGKEGNGPPPPGVFDHSTTMVGKDVLVVVGGVMVGRACNSEVHLLSLATLTWFTLNLNPLSFKPPSIHGHTAVEDPAKSGRLIVFGGRGASHWNTEVLTLTFSTGLWSKAV
ncbi:unnamed protein product, partial [Choristocarpus tenellus]